MAVVPIRVKRNGIEKTGEIGYTPEGKSRLSTTTVAPDPKFDQPIKEGLVRMVIEFDPTELNSELVNIRTCWGKAYLSPNGKVVSKIEEREMLTNEADKAAFTAMFAPTIFRFALNGRVRSLEGHNDKPVFNAQGAVITYTEADENAEPTGGYWVVPSPPINPA